MTDPACHPHHQHKADPAACCEKKTSGQAENLERLHSKLLFLLSNSDTGGFSVFRGEPEQKPIAKSRKSGDLALSSPPQIEATLTQELFEAIVVLLIGIVLLGAIYYLAPVVFSAIWTARKALKNVKSTAESELTRENIQGFGKEIQGFTKENIDGAARLSYAALQNVRCYLSFSGKSSRRSFIAILLIGNFLIGIPLGFGLLAMTSDLAFVALLGGVTVIAMVIASCWISWAASSRRMRDTGVNPWWTLALLVPPLNFAAMVFLLLVPSDEFAGRGL